MKILLFLCCLTLPAFAVEDSELQLQEKRVRDRAQELKDAKDYGGETKIARKQARLDEENAELDKLKEEDKKDSP